jgi:haloacetate dehalogenase
MPAQTTTQTTPLHPVPSEELQALLPGFTHSSLALPQVTVHYSVGGAGPALLCLAGHPQTRAIWHRVAVSLMQRFTMVLADIRGYGDTSRPPCTEDHAPYSKRAMAQDQIDLMQHLGFAQFSVLAHDRGARVAHRLMLDHPHAVTRAALLDICPTVAMYEGATELFARKYWHWFFLIQKAPLPERLIQADPALYVQSVMGSRHAGLAAFDPRALQEYLRCAALPRWSEGICEDYRAAATIDLEHDRVSRAAGQQVQCPLMVLWGEHGVVHQCFDVLPVWRAYARDVRGQPLPCGHYIPEEAPQALLTALQDFL